MKITKLISKDNMKQNTYLVEDNMFCVLIDCSCDLNDLKIEKLDAILITHAHGDHVKTVTEVAEKYCCPVYICEGFEELAKKKKNLKKVLPLHENDVLFEKLRLLQLLDIMQVAFHF